MTHTEKNSVKGYLETQKYQEYGLHPVTLKWKCISGTYGLGALPQGEYTIHKCYKLKEIKAFSNKKISDITINSNIISDFIFKGVGNFVEPYTAQYIIENDDPPAQSVP